MSKLTIALQFAFYKRECLEMIDQIEVIHGSADAESFEDAIIEANQYYNLAAMKKLHGQMKALTENALTLS